MQLPEPSYDGSISLEKVLCERRSFRYYTGEELLLQEVSQLLWAAQGITSRQSERTAPSAGGLFPLQLLLVAGNVDYLEAAVYRYIPEGHEVEKSISGDKRFHLAQAALEQQYIAEAAVDLVITATYDKITSKYNTRGISYAHMEAGHVSQNIYLQATALNLGTVAIGAFDTDRISRLLNLDVGEEPLYIMPVGRKA